MTSLALLVVRIRVAEEPDVSTLAWPSRLVGCEPVWKIAVSVTGLLMVIDGVGLEVPLKHPTPVQDQFWKVNPLLGVAVMLRVEPEATHSLDGAVVPPPVGVMLTVRKY
jgi:hypothetical protein